MTKQYRTHRGLVALLIGFLTASSNQQARKEAGEHYVDSPMLPYDTDPIPPDIVPTYNSPSEIIASGTFSNPYGYDMDNDAPGYYWR